MAIASFSVALDGPAVSDGTIDVRDLAPALLAIGQLFDAANLALNGDQVKVNVRVRATGKGSFEVDLQALQSLVSQIRDIFAGDGVTAILNIKELLIGTAAGGYGLFRLIKKLRGKNPSKVQDLGNGYVRIEFDDDTFEVPLKLLRLYQDLSVREAATKVVMDAIDRDGIDKIEFKENGVILETVKEGDREYFVAPEVPDELLVEEIRKAAFSIISLAFKEDNKWRLHDGNTQISATIADESFMARVNANQVAFAKGDILVCNVRVTQKRGRDGLKTEYEVEQVLEHRLAARQLELLIEPPPAKPPGGVS